MVKGFSKLSKEEKIDWIIENYFDSEFEEECREQYGDNMPDLKDSNEFRKISEETGEGDLSS